jgi:uncharacterized protein (TIGR02186 family)
MRSRMLKRFCPVLVLAFLLALPAPNEGEEPCPAAPASSFSVALCPAEIAVNMFYDGATLHVTGRLPAEYSGAAVLCIGKEGELELKKKGKVLGLLWVSVGQVKFEAVPSVYLLTSTEPLAALAPPEVQDSLGIGYDALRERSVEARGESGQKGLFGELVKLKESGGFFSITEGGMKLEPAPPGASCYAAECPIPARIAPGTYEVQVFGFKGSGATREGELLGSEPLTVRQVGLAALIATLARESGLLCGIVAVIVAIGVGLLTGFVFGLGSRGGH